MLPTRLSQLHDLLGRALREEAAAACSRKPEAQAAHETLARLYREKAAEFGHPGDRGLGALHG